MFKIILICLFVVLVRTQSTPTLAPAPGPTDETAPGPLPAPRRLPKRFRNGCLTAPACGPDGVLQSKRIESKDPETGMLVVTHACQCKDGRLIHVDYRGRVVGPDNKPIGVPDIGEIDPEDFANSLKQFPPCKNISIAELSNPDVKPSDCAGTLRIGQVCTKGCELTFKALGLDCYIASSYLIADPRNISSTAERVFNECTAGLAYTGIAPPAPAPAPAPAPLPTPTVDTKDNSSIGSASNNSTSGAQRSLIGLLFGLCFTVYFA